jgi:hypothetical protein
MVLFLGAAAFPGWVGAVSAAEEPGNLETEESTEVWGDPEEHSEPDQTWTWFGMGYEQRTNMLNSQGAGGGSNAQGDKGGPSK